jgi:hypothetical protein
LVPAAINVSVWSDNYIDWKSGFILDGRMNSLNGTPASSFKITGSTDTINFKGRSKTDFTFPLRKLQLIIELQFNSSNLFQDPVIQTLVSRCLSDPPSQLTFKFDLTIISGFLQFFMVTPTVNRDTAVDCPSQIIKPLKIFKNFAGRKMLPLDDAK